MSGVRQRCPWARPWCRPGTRRSQATTRSGPTAGSPGARSGALEQLRGLGVLYWKLDADKYENDPELEKIREETNYSWMDVITICKDKLPNYEEKIKMFYEEYLHLDDEIRYILDGSGYFNVRDKEDSYNQDFKF